LQIILVGGNGMQVEALSNAGLYGYLLRTDMMYATERRRI